MAKINLKIVTDITQSQEKLEALAKSIKSTAESFSSVKVDKNLTAQIKALTEHYRAVAAAAQKVVKVNYNNQIQEEKLAQAKAKTGKAIAAETKEMNAANLVRQKTIKATNDETRAQEKHEAQMKKSTEQVKKSAKETEKHSQSIVSMIPNIIKCQVAMTAVMLPLRKLQEGLDSINETLIETEKRVVSLRRVAGQAANANELYDLAQKYGQTFDNVADVVENLVKSGYTWEESLKAAEPALLAINVAELDATQATEGLIAVVKQYGMELEDLNYIQGVLNKTADNAAVTTEKLLIALQKTGSTAKNANVSFEDTVGLITALSEGTAASGQNIGNALRSLFVFTSDRKALDSFAGLSDGMAETVKKYRAGQASILDVWKGLGGELQGMNSQKGTLEDLFGGAEMTADIEAQLTQITDSFAEIYGTAGNYRQNYFIALLDNIAKVEDATKDLSDATSYSQKENEKYLDTYEAKVNSLNTKWKQLANDEQGFLSFKKGIVELGTIGLEGIEKIGGLRTVAIALGGALTTILVPAIKVTNVKLTELGITASASLGWISAAITAISVLTGLVSAYQQSQHEENQEAIQNWELIKKQTAELDKLYNEYLALTPEARNYAEVEKSLVTALGEKAVALEDLTKGTNDYREAVKRLAKEELEEAKIKYAIAGQAAKDELVGSITQNSTFNTGGIRFKRTGKNPLDGTGIEHIRDANFRIAGLKEGKTAEEVIYNLDQYKKTVEALYKLAYSEGNEDNRDSYLRLAGIIQDKIDATEPKVDAYENTKNSYDLILDRLQEIEEETEKTEETTENLATNLSKLDSDVLSSIADKFKEIRDATQEAYDFEEKKKAVLEAEQALADAYNEREVRIYNAQTGRWEMKSRQADIQKAQENLDKAREEIEKAAYDNIIDELESGNTTNEAILAIIAKWQGAYGNGDFSHVSDSVKDVISEFGVDLTKKETGIEKIDSFEDAKLLMQKLLEPISDSDFAKNVKEKGILFGTTKTVADAVGNMIFNNQRTSQDSHNVYMNGVTIPRDVAQGHSILDIFGLFPLLGD